MYLRFVLRLVKIVSLLLFYSSVVGIVFGIVDLLFVHQWHFPLLAILLLIGVAAVSWFVRGLARTALGDKP